jgi:hypothetical protein
MHLDKKSIDKHINGPHNNPMICIDRDLVLYNETDICVLRPVQWMLFL